MTIKVTAKNIRRGTPRNPASCPVALAISEAMGDEAEFVRVEEEYVAIRKPRRITYDSVNSPRSVVRFIKAFDKGADVKPFSFWLAL